MRHCWAAIVWIHCLAFQSRTRAQSLVVLRAPGVGDAIMALAPCGPVCQRMSIYRYPAPESMCIALSAGWCIQTHRPLLESLVCWIWCTESHSPLVSSIAEYWMLEMPSSTSPHTHSVISVPTVTYFMMAITYSHSVLWHCAWHEHQPMSQRNAELIYHDPPCPIQHFEHARPAKCYNPATLDSKLNLRSNRNPSCHAIHTRANMLVINMSGFCFSLANEMLDMIQSISGKRERGKRRKNG